MAKKEIIKIELEKPLLVRRYDYSTNKKSDLKLEIAPDLTVIQKKVGRDLGRGPETATLEPGTHLIKREKTKAVIPLPFINIVKNYEYYFFAFRSGDLSIKGETTIEGKRANVEFVTSFRDPNSFHFNAMGAMAKYTEADLFRFLLAALEETPSYKERVASLLENNGKIEVTDSFSDFGKRMEGYGLAKPRIHFILN